MNEGDERDKFAEVKDSVEASRLRACDLFSQKKLTEAIKVYQRILQTVNLAKTSNEKEAKDRKDILIRTHTNLAVCFNKREDWKEALHHVEQLEAEVDISSQPKILYAKGRALMKLGEIDKALAALKQAMKLLPLDKQIGEAIEELKNRKNSYDSFRKTFASNLKFQ